MNALSMKMNVVNDEKIELAHNVHERTQFQSRVFPSWLLTRLEQAFIAWRDQDSWYTNLPRHILDIERMMMNH